MYEIFFSSQAVKDIQKLKRSNLSENTKELIKIVMQNPYQSPPPFEKLKGNLEGYYSRRINIQHRLVYQVIEHEKIVKVLRLWTHYE